MSIYLSPFQLAQSKYSFAVRFIVVSAFSAVRFIVVFAFSLSNTSSDANSHFFITTLFEPYYFHHVHLFLLAVCDVKTAVGESI